eukprot:7380126-Pyramimonas_sp.AAC.1
MVSIRTRTSGVTRQLPLTEGATGLAQAVDPVAPASESVSGFECESYTDEGADPDLDVDDVRAQITGGT